MVRLDGSRYDPWAVFHCFELRIGSPYSEPAANNAYKPFDVTKTPNCKSPGLNSEVKIECRLRSRYVLQFWFEKLSEDAANAPIQTIEIEGFTNPMSAQVLRDVEIYAFSDSQCRKPSMNLKLPGINIQPSTESLKLKAGNLFVGDTQVNNTLEMIIPKPNSTMAQGTTGQLEVIMPPWYKIGKVEIPSFKNTMCASPCMNFAWAWAHSNTIYLKYKDLSNKCRIDDEVSITCRGFRSPINPGRRLVDVKISTFDNEKDQKPISILSGNLKDA